MNLDFDTVQFAEALLNGLSYSSILILTAVGLSITFGVMRVINMAHGEMLMLGAYTGFVVSQYSVFGGMNLFVAIPISFLVVGFVGFMLETCLIRYLYGRPLDTLLATWGVSLVLQQAVRLYFGPDLRSLSKPEILEGSFRLADYGIYLGELSEVGFPKYRLFVVGIAALCVLAVYLCFYGTTFGLRVRAVTQNRAMAAAMGISTRRIDALTFAFGTGLAGIAGCILAHMYTSKPNMGMEYIVDAFMVVILGGMGNLGGTILAGILIGTGKALVAKPDAFLYAGILVGFCLLLAGYYFVKQLRQQGFRFGNAAALVGKTGLLLLALFMTTILGGKDQLARVWVLFVVIGFIMYRPAGLFVTKERVYD